VETVEHSTQDGSSAHDGSVYFDSADALAVPAADADAPLALAARRSPPTKLATSPRLAQPVCPSSAWASAFHRRSSASSGSAAGATAAAVAARGSDSDSDATGAVKKTALCFRRTHLPGTSVKKGACSFTVLSLRGLCSPGLVRAMVRWVVGEVLCWFVASLQQKVQITSTKFDLSILYHAIVFSGFDLSILIMQSFPRVRVRSAAGSGTDSPAAQPAARTRPDRAVPPASRASDPAGRS
jgi:hypothetical protein